MNLLRDFVQGYVNGSNRGADLVVSTAKMMNRSTPWGQANQQYDRINYL